jgi:hypothetical protein
MKIRNHRNDGGSAMLVVMVLLVLMSVIVVSNSISLRHLHREMQRIEKEQMRKYQPRKEGKPERTKELRAASARSNGSGN